jgi:hypothetical protein
MFEIGICVFNFVLLKTMRYKGWLIAVALFVSHGLYAQEMKQKAIDMRDYQYKKEASGGVRVQTNGVGLFMEYGWIKDIFRTRLLQFEYSYYIDFRQKKQKSGIQDGRDYYYGLQNKFHTIRISYGIKRTIVDKADRNGVRLSFVAFGGFALGLLKPYYLNLAPNDSSANIRPERYSSANANRFLDRSYIAEAAPLRYGLNQIQPVPGITGKVGLDFDWGKKDEFVKALAVGVMLDLYYKKLPIMINDYNHFYQISFYLSFQFGKRW